VAKKKGGIQAASKTDNRKGVKGEQVYFCTYLGESKKSKGPERTEGGTKKNFTVEGENNQTYNLNGETT